MMWCPACHFPLDNTSMSSTRSCWCTGSSEDAWSLFEHQQPFLPTPNPTALPYSPLPSLFESGVKVPSLPTQSNLGLTKCPVKNSIEQLNGSGGASMSPSSQLIRCGDVSSNNPRTSSLEGDFAIEESTTPASDIDKSGKSHVICGHRGIPKSSVTRTGLYRCEWRACKYPGVFSREAELMRHIRSKHVCPGLYKCPEENRRRSFNRKDNMMEHLRRKH
ncbi:hypothetical protein BDV41DRAFT_269356 [Aspergillus transmontanensis]|uniref:C2H2-type domain-containing protein n=1 Tax=Aspergillus transmontanensis TaxID=1034304 RepID=A0A5N6VZD7_9EURO|nr:hypothetical protein BDV41DRAFT_269356 [Aspergillus transmontanensis]